MFMKDTLRVTALLLHLPFFFYFIIPCVSSIYDIINLIYNHHEKWLLFQRTLSLAKSQPFSFFTEDENSSRFDEIVNFASISSVIIIFIILLLLFAAIAQLVTVLNVFILKGAIPQTKLDILCCLWLIPPLILRYEFDENDFFGHLLQLNPLALAIFVIQVTYERWANWPVELSALGLLVNIAIVLSNHITIARSSTPTLHHDTDSFIVIVDKIK